MAVTMKKTRYAGVYRDKSNNIFYQVSIGRDENGRYHTKKSRTNKDGKPFETEKEAYQAAVKVKQKYEVLSGQANYRMTYGMFMDKKFIPKYKGDVEQSTFESHQQAFKIVKQHFDKKLLLDITVADCEEFRTWLLTKSGYSKAYASMIYLGLRQSLNYAVQIGMLDKNVSLQTKSIGKGKSKPKIWTKEEFEKVLSVMSTERYYGHFEFITVWLYYMTGIRVGEGQALYWEDIDFKHHKLHVRNTLQIKNKHDYQRKPYTKTQNGIRIITLDKCTLKFLKEWRKRQAKHCKSEFVVSYDGQPILRCTIGRIIKRYARLADVPVINGKALRHSHVSYLINEFNADVLTVSRRLGHSSPDITLKYYAHMWPRGDEWLVNKMDGNIEVNLSPKDLVQFGGNQSYKA